MTGKKNTIAISVSAGHHARARAAGDVVWALNQISCDSAVFVPRNGFALVVRVMPIANRSGAVSPAARAIASIALLTMPASAAGSATDVTVRHRRAPSASLA